jgi:hypothetical protein
MLARDAPVRSSRISAATLRSAERNSGAHSAMRATMSKVSVSALEFMKDIKDRGDRCDTRNTARGTLYQPVMAPWY